MREILIAAKSKREKKIGGKKKGRKNFNPLSLGQKPQAIPGGKPLVQTATTLASS